MTQSEAESRETVRQWMALAMTSGIGPTRCRRLLEHFGSIGNIFRASLTELEAARIPASAAQAIALGSSMEAAVKELEKAVVDGVRVITPSCREFPNQLKNIYDPPMVLYVRGNVDALTAPSIAVIGTRHPTPYGVGMAEKLSADLAARGFVIISGLARGVDTSAHRGAVAVSGTTVGVLGTGVDHIYPRENQKLADQMLAKNGALVSEFPLGTSPKPENFPIRNRIISGLSYGVLVLEAGEYSGTRITARCALEQGRDIFAVPGNVTNKLSWGPNTLIKQGAKLVATWEDIWEELPSDLRLKLRPKEADESLEPATASLFKESETSLGPKEQSLMTKIKADVAIQLDELVETLDGKMSTADIFSALFELELAGKIKQLPGKNFVRVF